MFYRTLLVFFFSLCATVNLYANTDINEKFNEFVKSLQSTITVEKNDIKTDIKMLSNGMQFEIFRLKGEIKHPITGEPMGKQRVKVGEASVINGKLQFSAKEPLLSGDEITIKLPFQVETDFSSLNKNQIYEINFELNKNRVVNTVAVSDYKFTCMEDKAGSDIVCNLTHSGNQLIQAKVSDDALEMVPILYQDITGKKDTRFKFNREINSIAVGSIYGKDKGEYLLGADNSRIFIYRISDNLSLEYAGSIEGDFTSIVSVEIADVNGNGVDEVFISNLTEKNSTASSFIYEFDGTKFDIKKSKLGYLFRSYYSDSKKSVLIQNYINQGFTGLIGVYGFVDGDYKVVTDISGTLGQKVYGSGMLSSGDYAFIDKAGNFAIRYSDSSTPTSKQLFGDTNKHIFYSKEKVVGTRSNPAGGEMDMTEVYTVAYPIYQRIIEVDRNKFFLSENIPVGSSVDKIDYFKSALFSVYLISLSNTSNKLDVYDYQKPIIAEPALSEADIITINGDEYIFMLTNLSTDRYKTSSNSLLTVIKLVR